MPHPYTEVLYLRSLNAIRGCDLCFQLFGGREKCPSEEVEGVLLRDIPRGHAHPEGP